MPILVKHRSFQTPAVSQGFGWFCRKIRMPAPVLIPSRRIGESDDSESGGHSGLLKLRLSAARGPKKGCSFGSFFFGQDTSKGRRFDCHPIFPLMVSIWFLLFFFF